ncbi:MAG: hypothetical protein U0401_30395 [Anaerolineae bacterium]
MLRLNGKYDQKGRERASGDGASRSGRAAADLPSQLSGRQQQRVAVPAPHHNPQLVLTDEPAASLDTERAFQVVETFAHLIHRQNRVGHYERMACVCASTWTR